MEEEKFETPPKVGFRDKKLNREIFELLGIDLFFIFMAGLLPAILGLGLGGFLKSEYLGKCQFYPFLFFSGLIAFNVLKLLEIFTQGKVDCIAHDPEQGLLNFSWTRNPIKLFFISLIVFSLLGMFSAYKNTFFVGVPQAMFPPETKNNIVNILFSAEPAASSETIFFTAIVMSGLFSLVLYFMRKKNWELNKGSYFVTIIPLSLICGLLWMGFHSLAYGGQDVALWATFMFGTLGALMTFMLNSIIPWYVWHFCNNAYVSMNSLYGDTSILMITLVINLIIIVPFIMITIAKRKKKM